MGLSLEGGTVPLIWPEWTSAFSCTKVTQVMLSGTAYRFSGSCPETPGGKGSATARWLGGTRTIWSPFFPCNAHRHNVKRWKISGGLVPPPPRGRRQCLVVPLTFAHDCTVGCIVKEVFLLDQRELMKLCGADTWKYKIWQYFLEKLHFRSAPEVKRGQISPKCRIFPETLR